MIEPNIPLSDIIDSESLKESIIQIFHLINIWPRVKINLWIECSNKCSTIWMSGIHLNIIHHNQK